MTKYDLLIDSIVQELYDFKTKSFEWDEDVAKQSAHAMLELVEKYQSTFPKQTIRWRASD